MCGIIGVFGPDNDAGALAVMGLYQLQHRGQETCGLSVSDGQTIRTHKGIGYVNEVLNKKTVQEMRGHIAVAHTRYSTAGGPRAINSQPFQIDCKHGTIAVVHNGNLTNHLENKSHLVRNGAIYATDSDTETILHLYAHSSLDNDDEAIIETLYQLEGAYSLIFMLRDRLIAARDPNGFRPMALGMVNNTYVIASETCAFDILGAKRIRDIEPGEVVTISESGLTSTKPFPGSEMHQCVFEHVYFARPDSEVFGTYVNETRMRMGRNLAKEVNLEADVVVPVPDSGNLAAQGYAEASGLPFRFGLTRNHYVGRTFILPDQDNRIESVKHKLNPAKNLLSGKRVILVDDSIVRGTTSRKIVRMVRKAGAVEVHLLISCPPTISSCYYGVDTPRRQELIAATKSVEEIRQYIGADTLTFLSLEGLMDAVDGPRGFCTSCYTGKYPVNRDAKFIAIERRKSSL